MDRIDRRGILKLLGVGSAVVTAGTPSAPSLEVVTIPDVVPEPSVDWNRMFEVTAGSLYSQVTIEKNSMDSNYSNVFSSTVGQMLPCGGRVDFAMTNMLCSNKLPAPQHFLVERIGVLFSPTVERRLASVFAERYQLEVIIGEKVFFRAPIASLAGVQPMFPMVSGDEASRSDWGALRMFSELHNRPLLIDDERYFSAHLGSFRPLNVHGKIVLWVVLGGQHLRPRV